MKRIFLIILLFVPLGVYPEDENLPKELSERINCLYREISFPEGTTQEEVEKLLSQDIQYRYNRQLGGEFLDDGSVLNTYYVDCECKPGMAIRKFEVIFEVIFKERKTKNLKITIPSLYPKKWNIDSSGINLHKHKDIDDAEVLILQLEALRDELTRRRKLCANQSLEVTALADARTAPQL